MDKFAFSILLKTNNKMHRYYSAREGYCHFWEQEEVTNDENKSRRCTHYRKVKSAELYGIMREERKVSLNIHFLSLFFSNTIMRRVENRYLGLLTFMPHNIYFRENSKQKSSFTIFFILELMSSVNLLLFCYICQSSPLSLSLSSLCET